MTLQRQISRQFEGKRQIPFASTHHEIGHGREITWAMRAKEAVEHIKADWPGQGSSEVKQDAVSEAVFATPAVPKDP